MALFLRNFVSLGLVDKLYLTKGRKWATAIVLSFCHDVKDFKKSVWGRENLEESLRES